MTCFIFSYLYLFYCYLFFSSSSWIRAYSCWALMSWDNIKNYFESLSFGLFFEPSFILLIFLENGLEPVKFFLFTLSDLSFFKGDFFFDFGYQEMIKLIFFSLLNFFSFVFVLDLSVSHFFLKFDFSLVLVFLFSLSFIVEFGLLLLKFEILFALFFLTIFFSAFFFHLLIELFFYFFLKFLFSHFLEFFFFFKEFGIKLDKSGPFVILIALNLINRFWSHRTCLRASLWTWDLALSFFFVLVALWWCLASFLNAVSLIELVFRYLGFGFFGGRFFWIRNKYYSSDFVFYTHQQLWRHLVWEIWGILRWFFPCQNIERRDPQWVWRCFCCL